MQSALAAGELRASKQAAPRHSSNPSLQSSQLVPMRSKQGPLPPLNPWQYNRVRALRWQFLIRGHAASPQRASRCSKI